jgi:hypothetical protein
VTVWRSSVAAGQFRDLLMQTVTARYGAHPTRSVAVTPVEIGGHPAVVYVDAPAGAGTKLVDAGKIVIGG